jgi:hypothetical protein
MGFIKYGIKVNSCDVCSCGEQEIYFALPDDLDNVDEICRAIENALSGKFYSVGSTNVVEYGTNILLIKQQQRRPNYDT